MRNSAHSPPNYRAFEGRRNTHLLGKAPVWHWLTVVNVEPVVVAAGWQILLGRSLGRQVPFLLTLALCASVWWIYMLDRILDGPKERSLRHRFAASHRVLLLITVGIVVIGLAVGISPRLSPEIMGRGILVASCCSIYLGASQRYFSRSVAKHFAMALLFSSGVVLIFDGPGIYVAFAATALVVWANTWLTERAESGAPPSRWVRCCMLVSGLALLSAGSSYLMALGLGCWMMVCIDVYSDLERASANSIGALLDAALAVSAWLFLMF